MLHVNKLTQEYILLQNLIQPNVWWHKWRRQPCVTKMPKTCVTWMYVLVTRIESIINSLKHASSSFLGWLEIQSWCFHFARHLVKKFNFQIIHGGCGGIIFKLRKYLSRTRCDAVGPDHLWSLFEYLSCGSLMKLFMVLKLNYLTQIENFKLFVCGSMKTEMRLNKYFGPHNTG